MPRNGSGTYSVPNTYTTGQTITAAIINANFADAGSEITGSVATDGQSSMTGPLKASNGSASAPSLTFASDTNTGFYRKAADTIGITCAGTEVGEISATGLAMAIPVVPTGTMVQYVATTAPTGWVRANGASIGNASSGATERDNADTEDLFTLLWNSYSNSVCAVSSGRGASAAADFAANKTIALPDLQGRAFFGLDNMGAGAAGRLGSVITSSNGASGGSETVTLTASQMPTHAHDLANHTHTFSGTSSIESADHTHNVSGTTGAGGSHNHTEKEPIAGGNSGVGGSGFGTSNTTNTSTAPDHTHSFSATSGGVSANHQHTYSGTTSTPSSNTTSSAGSGTAHSNMPPCWLGTFIIKL